jgi:hypothetical protein
MQQMQQSIEEVQRELAGLRDRVDQLNKRLSNHEGARPRKNPHG